MRTSLARVSLSAAAWLLAAVLTVYASSKLFGYQFVLLESVGEHRLRDLTPMELAWAFFGHSYAYGLFLGLFELAACALLLHPRTRTLGAVLAATILANIVFIDVEYEIHGPLAIAVVLLVLALFLVAADWRSVVGAARALLHMGDPARATAAHPIRFALVVIAWLGWLLWICSFALERRTEHQHPLRGGWTLTQHTIDGASTPHTGATEGGEPTVWFEFAGATVLALDGKETQGVVAFAEDGRTMRWFMDLDADASEFEATVDLDGDRLVLSGTRDGQRMRMELLRRPRWRPVETR
ncbi:MAG: hypothetical protein KDB80_11025 [Planctomycetes bacterium]|nr:hypothetical protein [Planctomycetota bacterium]